jgi:hypothetical protein
MRLAHRNPLNRVSVMRALIPKLSQLVFIHAPVLRVYLASLAATVDLSVRVPEKGKCEGTDAYHTERNGMATSISRSVFSGAAEGQKSGRAQMGGENVLDKGRHDARGIADCELKARRGGTLTVARRVRGKLENGQRYD